MSDMATMPIRELIAEMKAKAETLADNGNLLDCLVTNTLANRLAAEADKIDELESENDALREIIEDSGVDADELLARRGA
jgi:hypothetical protein